MCALQPQSQHCSVLLLQNRLLESGLSCPEMCPEMETLGDFLLVASFSTSFICPGVMWSRYCCKERFTWCLCLVSSYSLKMRTFSTFDFYKKHANAMTPAGLAFFQCQWDSSVTSTFHQLLSKEWGCWRGSVGGTCPVAAGSQLVLALVQDQHRLSPS